MDELEEKLKRTEKKRNLIWTWDSLSETIPSAPQRLFDYLEKAPHQSLPQALPMKVAAIGREHPNIAPRAINILQRWSEDNRRTFGRAAKEALGQLKDETN